ncbi:MAG: cupredoxin domain-containing protein [Armatimonadetes bacterium]|nr:cupredoxin domain-containing protein [Armatimonadota bacterium]
MKRIVLRVTVALLALLSLGCAQPQNGSPQTPSPQPASPQEGAQQEGAPQAASPQAGKLHVEVTDQGFVPASLEVQAGAPVELEFVRRTDKTCATEVQSKELGIPPTKLPLNQPVTVRFEPPESGRYTYACQMDMIKGTVIVQED